MLRCVIGFLFLGAMPVLAAPDEAAFALFEAGEYELAAENAAAIGGAENFALAARALNAKAYLQEDNGDARDLAKAALDYAEAAMEADDGLVEGHLQAAISLAQRGSRMGAMRAFFLGIAGRARDELDLALAHDPENPWALSSSAAWNLEVSRRAGEGRFGSDPEIGYQQFMAARRLDPGNLLIAYECALRLLAADNPEWRADGLASLEAITTGEPADSFEEAMKERALALREAIAAGEKAERKFIDAQP